MTAVVVCEKDERAMGRLEASCQELSIKSGRK